MCVSNGQRLPARVISLALTNPSWICKLGIIVVWGEPLSFTLLHEEQILLLVSAITSKILQFSTVRIIFSILVLRTNSELPQPRELYYSLECKHFAERTQPLLLLLLFSTNTTFGSIIATTQQVMWHSNNTLCHIFSRIRYYFISNIFWNILVGCSGCKYHSRLHGRRGNLLITWGG